MEDPGRQSSQKADRQRLEKSRVVPPLALVISLRPSKRLVADVASRWEDSNSGSRVPQRTAA